MGLGFRVDGFRISGFRFQCLGLMRLGFMGLGFMGFWFRVLNGKLRYCVFGSFTAHKLHFFGCLGLGFRI